MHKLLENLPALSIGVLCVLLAFFLNQCSQSRVGKADQINTIWVLAEIPYKDGSGTFQTLNSRSDPGFMLSCADHELRMSILFARPNGEVDNLNENIKLDNNRIYKVGFHFPNRQIMIPFVLFDDYFRDNPVFISSSSVLSDESVLKLARVAELAFLEGQEFNISIHLGSHSYYSEFIETGPSVKELWREASGITGTLRTRAQVTAACSPL